jgi:hypothetical protein
MTEEQYNDLVKDHIEHIKKYMSEAGGLFPHLTIFADHKDAEEDENKAVIHMIIPPEFMNDDESKDTLVEDILPEMFKEVKKEFIPYGIGWASEAWMRVANTDEFNPEVDDYKKIPIKKEVLFVSLETRDKSQTLIYEIKREGSQVNSSGELIDIINLEEMPALKDAAGTEGRLSGLFKKLNL